MKHCITRLRAGKREWLGYTQDYELVWRKARLYAWEFLDLDLTLRIAQTWANRGNGWRYQVHSMEIREITPNG